MRTLLRLHADNADIRVLLFQKTGGSHNGTGRAHTRDKMRDFTLSVAPDFRTGTFIVRQRIIQVTELIQHNPLTFSLHFQRHVTRQLHTAIFWREHQLGAIGFHALSAFYTLVFRHDQHHFIAAHRGHHRQCDTGIAAGRLNQRITRLDITARFRTGNHGIGRPVFHRARRVIALQLQQNRIAGIAGHTL